MISARGRAAVLPQFTRKEFVQIRKYRGATKEGISVKSKLSWRNQRWHRGELINIVAQQKNGISVKSKISWRNKRWHLGENINIVK
jgi:hypothetical protein